MDRNVFLVCAGVAAVSAMFYGKLPEWSGLLDFGMFMVFVAVLYWLMGPSRAERAAEKEQNQRQQERE